MWHIHIPSHSRDEEKDTRRTGWWECEKSGVRAEIRGAVLEADKRRDKGRCQKISEDEAFYGVLPVWRMIDCLGYDPHLGMAFWIDEYLRLLSIGFPISYLHSWRFGFKTDWPILVRLIWRMWIQGCTCRINKWSKQPLRNESQITKNREQQYLHFENDTSKDLFEARKRFIF